MTYTIHHHGGRVEQSATQPPPSISIARVLTDTLPRRAWIVGMDGHWHGEEPARPLVPCTCVACRCLWRGR